MRRRKVEFGVEWGGQERKRGGGAGAGEKGATAKLNKKLRNQA